PDLHEANAALDQTPSGEATASERRGGGLIEAIETLRCRGFTSHIERFRGVTLQAGGHLVAGDASLQAGIARILRQVLLIQLAQKRLALRLTLARDEPGRRGRMERGDRRRRIDANDGAGVTRRQKAGRKIALIV